jgi:hypothetical protein
MLWLKYHIKVKIAAEYSILLADQFLKPALYLMDYLVKNREYISKISLTEILWIWIRLNK